MPELDVLSDVYNAHLIERRDFNESLAEFKIAFDEGDVPGFQCGQYTTLGLVEKDENGEVVMGRRGPKLTRRAYSIASAPKNQDALTYYIVRVDDGALTPKLWDLKPGDGLFMDNRIKGHFTLESVSGGAEGKNLVLIGTGTGLAPFMSMIQEHRGTHLWNKVALFDGCRLVKDLGYFGELSRIAQEDPTITYLPTVTREPEDSDWQGLRGRITAHLDPDAFRSLAGFELDPKTSHIFMCGNPAMIDQCEGQFTDLGFVVKDRKNPEGNVHFERYW